MTLGLAIQLANEMLENVMGTETRKHVYERTCKLLFLSHCPENKHIVPIREGEHDYRAEIP